MTNTIYGTFVCFTCAIVFTFSVALTFIMLFDLHSKVSFFLQSSHKKLVKFAFRQKTLKINISRDMTNGVSLYVLTCKYFSGHILSEKYKVQIYLWIAVHWLCKNKTKLCTHAQEISAQAINIMFKSGFWSKVYHYMPLLLACLNFFLLYVYVIFNKEKLFYLILIKSIYFSIAHAFLEIVRMISKRRQ